MKIVDANIVLRYFLNDTEDLYEKSADILENNVVFIPNEVIAEIVYVYENILIIDIVILKKALKLYAERSFDFLDTLLYAYHN